ncbi:uncharacterized protein LOC114262831 [Camellia sinensis]|uniref:uncharacterized protein LOC114262831 n=1 Tax=Camellia sinensis TaxID=4442 RepID=UPI001036D823|nr:uncharacterized protein LOC114262831 [Camellia sinensis]
MGWNNQMYPIAYNVAEAECKESWTWFLQNLLQDISPIEEHGWTFMTDRQKKLFKGKELKDCVWKAAKVYTRIEWERHMTKLQGIDSKAYDWMMRVNPVQWSRHRFSPRTKSNSLLNNISECFNSRVLEARDKHIFSVMEMIRRALMVRMHDCRDNILKYKGPIYEKIQSKVEKRKLKSRVWIPTWSGVAKFGVRYGGDGYIVNLENKTCTYFEWDLTGIPCPHGVAAIFFRKERVEDYVHAYFKKETFLRTYETLINPLNGPDMWPKIGKLLLQTFIGFRTSALVKKGESSQTQPDGGQSRKRSAVESGVEESTDGQPRKRTRSAATTISKKQAMGSQSSINKWL